MERVRLKGGAMASVQVRSVGPAREACVPRGPVPPTGPAVDALVEWAGGAKMARLLIEPEAPAGLGGELAGRHFSATSPTQPQHTPILRLQSPDAMVNSFRRRRRYNIPAPLR